jgi:hypothetical protein
LLATPKNVTFPQFTDIIFVASGSSGMVWSDDIQYIDSEGF